MTATHFAVLVLFEGTSVRFCSRVTFSTGLFARGTDTQKSNSSPRIDSLRFFFGA